MYSAKFKENNFAVSAIPKTLMSVSANSLIFMSVSGIRAVGKVSWKKLEIEKFLVEKSEVGKFLFKLERTEKSWKEQSEVEKFLLNLEIFVEVRKFPCGKWTVRKNLQPSFKIRTDLAVHGSLHLNFKIRTDSVVH